MAKDTFKYEVQNVDKVKTLIDLLHKHVNDLPDELVKSLKEVADCKVCELDNDYFRRATNGYSIELKLTMDGVVIDRGVVSVNKILKRVTIYDDFVGGELNSLSESYVFPVSFSAVVGGKTIVEW